MYELCSSPGHASLLLSSLMHHFFENSCTNLSRISGVFSLQHVGVFDDGLPVKPQPAHFLDIHAYSDSNSGKTRNTITLQMHISASDSPALNSNALYDIRDV